MAIPTRSPYIIIGAGIHGLSTAYHLALQLKATGKGDGRDIIILDKSGICAGATGIACGVIRNNYFQPAMRELMAHSVNIWESDPETYSYHPVGYMQISCESMREDVAAIHAQQQAIGYESVFVDGVAESARLPRFRRRTVHTAHGCSHAPLSPVVSIAPRQEHHPRGELIQKTPQQAGFVFSVMSITQVASASR